MHSSYKAITVCCPGDSVTGGPEALHQLVDGLRHIGHNAHIAYYPVDRDFERPAAYAGYDVPQGPVVDEDDALVVLPETATSLIRTIKRARIAIWWVSVDNYLRAKRHSRFRDQWRSLKEVYRGRRVPLWRLHGVMHLSQTRYSADFLQRRGLPIAPLVDYVNRIHLAPCDHRTDRDNVVVYNPRKSGGLILSLQRKKPRIAFRAIQNMTAAEVAAQLRRAKLYADFGNHPGKERMPREAAVAGCCVITGRRGSAANPEDIPIPAKYKLDEHAPTFSSDFAALTDEIFGQYGERVKDFVPYQRMVQNEPNEFMAHLNAIFGSQAHSRLVDVGQRVSVQ